MKRNLLACTAVGVVLSAVADPVVDFSFTAEDYAPGEALSDKGVTGARWNVPAGAVVTNVWDGVLNGIDITSERTGGVGLVANAEAGTGCFRQIDFTMNAGRLSKALSSPFDGAAALTPAAFEDGTLGFFGWSEDAWRSLSCDGADALVRAGGWIDGRIELKTIDDSRFVSYLVRIDGVWMRLRTETGRTWFATCNETAQTTCGAVGTGRLASLSVNSDEGRRPVCYHWIGGAAGDWNVATNWSRTADGEPADGCPEAGDFVRVQGPATVVRGGESATLTDFFACVQEDGGLDHWSGTFLTTLTLDTSRVRAGKPLEVVAATFGGLANPVVATWYRAPMAAGGKKGTYGRVATGLTYAPQKADYESWFRCDYSVEGGPVEAKEFFFSKLPVLYLTTDDGKTPTENKEKHTGWVTVQGNDEFKSPYDGKMTINVRGNTTAGQWKKPWKLKLDEKTKMFGIEGKSKHWVLLANAMDATGWRNKICYDFANEIGTTGMNSVFVTCFLNGSYQGLYQFCEQVRIGAGRVDIYDWESAGEDVAKALVKAAGLSDEAKDALKDAMAEDFRWVTSGQVDYDGVTYDLGDYVKDFESCTNDISGGYLYEFDSKNAEAPTHLTGVYCNDGIPTQVEGPEMLCSNPTMTTEAKRVLQEFFDASTSVDGYKDGKSFFELGDVDAAVAYFLAMEMTGNYDAAQNSRYAYKDRGQPLVFGPVWDCDLSLGSKVAAQFQKNARDPRVWLVSKRSFYREWADDPAFCTRLWQAYWTKARAAYQAGIEKIDRLQEDLREPLAANTIKWGNAGGEPQAEAADFVRSYMTDRLAWFDEQFADVPTLMAALKTSASKHPYEKDDASLVISVRCDSQRSAAAVDVTNDEIRSVAFLLDGIRLGEPMAVTPERTVAVRLPRGRIGTEADSCLALIAYAADGKTVVARNYCLVRRRETALRIILR